MKNKSATYILLTGVLAIWGLVFYRVFAGIDSEDTPAFVLSQKKSVQVVTQKEEEVFVLLANYRDPFLGGTSKAISNPSSGKNSSGQLKKVKVKKEEEVIDWSFLDYVGIIFNKETQKKVSILAISGKEYMVNDRDVINEVTILRKERDSIQVEYKGLKRWVVR
jgi:hypothetical protein